MIEPTKGKSRKRLKFLPEEDDRLRKLVGKYGENSWLQISSKMPGRNVRQCRERWKHYLSVDKTYKNPFTPEEDQIIIEKYFQLGPKWTKISKFLKGRSDIQIKTRLQKNLLTMNSIFLPNQVNLVSGNLFNLSDKKINQSKENKFEGIKTNSQEGNSKNQNMDSNEHQDNLFDSNNVNPLIDTIPDFKICDIFDKIDQQAAFPHNDIQTDNIVPNDYDFDLF